MVCTGDEQDHCTGECPLGQPQLLSSDGLQGLHPAHHGAPPLLLTATCCLLACRLAMLLLNWRRRSVGYTCLFMCDAATSASGLTHTRLLRCQIAAPTWCILHLILPGQRAKAGRCHCCRVGFRHTRLHASRIHNAILARVGAVGWGVLWLHDH